MKAREVARTAPGAAGWLDVAERGSAFGIRLMVALGRALGRRGARLLVRPLVLYFLAFGPATRRASRDYLRRLGLPHGLRAVLAHCRCFANCTLARMFWALGETAPFE